MEMYGIVKICEDAWSLLVTFLDMQVLEWCLLSRKVSVGESGYQLQMLLFSTRKRKNEIFVMSL